MVILFKILLICSLIPIKAFAHKVNLEDKSLEEIINKRMAKMQEIKSSSSKIYKIISSGNFEEIQKLNEILLHAAMEFKDLFPVALTSLEFDTSVTDIQYFTAQANFKYLVYNIVAADGRTRL